MLRSNSKQFGNGEMTAASDLEMSAKEMTVEELRKRRFVIGKT